MNSISDLLNMRSSVPEIIGSWSYDFCNAGESELVHLQLSLEIKQVNPFRLLETDPGEHKIPAINRGQEPLRRGTFQEGGKSSLCQILRRDRIR